MDQVKIGKFIAQCRNEKIVALKLQNAEGYLIGTISGILATVFYLVSYRLL